MKKNILFAVAVLTAGALMAADAPATDASGKDAVAAAAKAFSAQKNYSWTTTVTVPAGSRFRPGPTSGQTETGGYTHVSLSFGGNTTEMVLKDGKGAVNSPDNGWQSQAELDASTEGPGRFLGAMARDFKTPAVLVNEFVGSATGIKKDEDAYAGDLSEAEVKSLLTFRVGGAASPTINDAKGTVKFWIADGSISKYETHVTGKVSFNGNDRDVDRTSTTEIKDVGTTKVEVSEEALKKLNPPAADEKPKK